MRIIEVVISPQGETNVQTRGFVGSECLQASKWLEAALGLGAADVKTPEFFQTAPAAQPLRVE